jgi:hypothetical protein
MITLHYLGTKHGGFGASVIRYAQRGYSEPARGVTHTEALLGGGPGNAIMASSSLVDSLGDGKGGVRTKTGVVLNSAHWLVLDLPDAPERNARASARWFAEHDGEPYDRRGAAGSVGQAIVQQSSDEWFCTEAVAASMGFQDPHMMCPAAFYVKLLEMGARDITLEFFGIAEAARWD